MLAKLKDVVCAKAALMSTAMNESLLSTAIHHFLCHVGPVAILFVAIRTDLNERFGNLDNGILILGLCGFEGRQPCVPHALNPLIPIRLLHGNPPAICAPTSGNREEIGGFHQGHAGVLDRQPFPVQTPERGR